MSAIGHIALPLLAFAPLLYPFCYERHSTRRRQVKAAEQQVLTRRLSGSWHQRSPRPRRNGLATLKFIKQSQQNLVLRRNTRRAHNHTDTWCQLLGKRPAAYNESPINHLSITYQSPTLDSTKARSCFYQCPGTHPTMPVWQNTSRSSRFAQGFVQIKKNA